MRGEDCGRRRLPHVRSADPDSARVDQSRLSGGHGGGRQVLRDASTRKYHERGHPQLHRWVALNSPGVALNLPLVALNSPLVRALNPPPAGARYNVMAGSDFYAVVNPPLTALNPPLMALNPPLVALNSPLVALNRPPHRRP
eukprot:1176268-Prorocentrum_minimum.AAC.1